MHPLAQRILDNCLVWGPNQVDIGPRSNGSRGTVSKWASYGDVFFDRISASLLTGRHSTGLAEVSQSGWQSHGPLEPCAPTVPFSTSTMTRRSSSTGTHSKLAHTTTFGPSPTFGWQRARCPVLGDWTPAISGL